MVGKSQIVQLYKELLRYSETVKLTDKKYLKEKIRQAFKDNREVSGSDLLLVYKVTKIINFIKLYLCFKLFIIYYVIIIF